MALIKCQECKWDVSTTAKTCPNCGAKVKKPAGILGWMLAILVAIIVLSVILSGESSAPTASVPAAKTPHQQAMESVSIKSLSWHKGGFDNVMLVTVTFQNSGPVAVKDIELTCFHSAKSGTQIDSNKRVLFDVIAAKKTKTVRDFNMGLIHTQAERTNCRITDLAIAS